MPLTPDRIREILQSGDFSQFVGEPEGGILDAKEQPYNLRGEAGKYDLAKDVSSFANTDGGFIIIGLKTEPGKTLRSEVIKEIRTFNRDLIDGSEYDDVLRSWLYPLPKSGAH
jgi:predicted HTH transcriptional regulator